MWLIFVRKSYNILRSILMRFREGFNPQKTSQLFGKDTLWRNEHICLPKYQLYLFCKTKNVLTEKVNKDYKIDYLWCPHFSNMEIIDFPLLCNKHQELYSLGTVIHSTVLPWEKEAVRNSERPAITCNYVQQIRTYSYLH